MKIGIMQPYFFPYIGYWQLINIVDKYVVYDDVNYINRGWINRNRILVEGIPKYFNLPILGASQNKLINQIRMNSDHKLKIRNLQILKSSYKKAPYFKSVYPLIEDIILYNEENMANYIFNSLKKICGFLGIKTELIKSSRLKKDCTLKGQEKIIDICKLLEATDYYNAVGGKELYSSLAFSKRDLHLYFLKTDDIKYKQFENEFQSNLSIIDVMMFNSLEEIRNMLYQYTLLCN